MRTYKQFLEEARRMRMTHYYHGTPSAEKIKKSGFNTSEVHASTSPEIARSFGNRYAGNTRTIKISVPSKHVKTEAPTKVLKTQGQRGINRWGGEEHSVIMSPEYATKHITKNNIIHAPKVPSKYQDRSPFKRRTQTQPKKKK